MDTTAASYATFVNKDSTFSVIWESGTVLPAVLIFALVAYPNFFSQTAKFKIYKAWFFKVNKLFWYKRDDLSQNQLNNKQARKGFGVWGLGFGVWGMGRARV